MAWVFRAFDVLKGPALFETLWRLAARFRPLTSSEIKAASAVLGPGAMQYGSIRVAEGRLLSIVFRLNKGRAFATFHVVNLPSFGSHSSSNLDIVIHELVHVLQFEHVGSVYIWEALRAQWTAGYGYGGWQQLAADRRNAKRFRDFNREQQGQIARDYYNAVVKQRRSEDDPVRRAYEPFIADLRKGEL